MKVRLLFLISVILSTVGCLRYTPSFKELRDNDHTPGADSEYADAEAFYQFQQQQEGRLKELLSQREVEQGELAESDYKIGPEDVVQLTVFDVEELNRSVRVRPSGSISLPLVGTMMVAGLTEDDLQKELSKRLVKFMYDPQVHVFISEYSAHKVNVIGEVAKPGAYPLRRNDYSLVEILSEAGGKTQNAGGTIVLIPQQGAAHPENPEIASARAKLAGNPANAFGIEIYFDDLVGSVNSPPLSIPLRPGDTIVVPEAGKVQVDGEVKTPGSFPLSSRTTLLGSIASAGGLSYSAEVSKVEVIRELGSGKKALLSVDLEKIALKDGQDIRLRDGDIVRVPSAGGRFATRQIIEGINSLFSFGVSGAVP